MASYTETAAKLTSFERKQLSSVVTYASKNALFVKRQQNHIHNFIYVRKRQVDGLSAKLDKEVEDENYPSKFETYKNIVNSNAEKLIGTSLGEQFNLINRVLSYRIIKARTYTFEKIEITKHYNKLSFNISVMDDTKTEFDKVKTALNQ